MADDDILLLPEASQPKPWWKKSKFLCPLLFIIGLICLIVAISSCFYKSAYHNAVGLNVMALNVWGVPASFGASDKENRMVLIGKMIQKKEFDVYLLEELWMRPDHETIRNLTADVGLYMTEVHQLALSDVCDGRAAPTFCSGLAIVSKYPFIETEFNSFSVHGNFWEFDGEYMAKKGVGRVRIEPQPNITVDIFITHTAAMNNHNHSNAYYREIQTREVVDHVKKSTADFAIVGGDFNVDPRTTSETSYATLTSELESTMEQFFGYLKALLEPKRATYGNPANTYSASYSPVLYDYILHRSPGANLVTVNLFDVPFLKGIIKNVVSDSSSDDKTAVKTEPKEVSFSDHEAVSSNLLLYKYRH